MNVEKKLTLLADAAKYDASCTSSGSRRKNRGRGLGNAAPSGICHSYTEDGRCVSLLKVLFSNHCVYDCAYCVNRCSNDIPRAAFTIHEIVSLTIDFYRRNYIEGLFLSSGVVRSPDDTMERLVRTVQFLRKQGFNGYIHLKCVPFASKRLIQTAGRYADRLSVNIELPSEASLEHLTRDKTYASVLNPMGIIRETIAETRADRQRMRHAPVFAPAGQSTQLIVGASPESDYDILQLADRLYRQQALKRVYYSAYIPVAGAPKRLPNLAEPPLRRENRLYQADWLLRLYGYTIDEVIDSSAPWLDLTVDPKQAYARRHPELFPVDINTDDREMILKVPGIGLKSANRIMNLRQQGRIRVEHLHQLGAIVSRARPFIRCDGLPTTHWSNIPLPLGPRQKAPARSPETRAPASSGRVFETDGSFEGLLCAIFEAYKSRRPPTAIVPRGPAQQGLFEQHVAISTDPFIADRVWKRLKAHLGAKRRRRVYDAYLSNLNGVETTIFQMISQAIGARTGTAAGSCLSACIQIDTISRKVRREAHRMKGLVRFQQTGDDRYLAIIAPRYDILPLIRRHFESRYGDQRWIIYDTQRDYGFGYDGSRTRAMQVDRATLAAASDPGVDAKEALCRLLWQRYFAAVNVQQRNNLKRHVSQLPRRYWRYLPEKQL